MKHSLFTGTKNAFDIFYVSDMYDACHIWTECEYSSFTSSPVVQSLVRANGVVAIFGFDSFYTSRLARFFLATLFFFRPFPWVPKRLSLTPVFSHPKYT